MGHNFILHTVRPFETVFSIASRYGITTEELLRFNGMNPQTPIRPGMTIRIPIVHTPPPPRPPHFPPPQPFPPPPPHFPPPQPFPPPPPPHFPPPQPFPPPPSPPARPVLPQNRVHFVRHGETIQSIARMYGVTVQNIMFMNGLTCPCVRVGQRLIIPATISPLASAILPLIRG